MITTAVAWPVGFTLLFPMLWTFVTGFKTGAEAIASPPSFLFFDWNVSACDTVNQRTNYLKQVWNSVVISFAVNILCWAGRPMAEPSWRKSGAGSISPLVDPWRNTDGVSLPRYAQRRCQLH